jgi:hypothetical protein
VLKVEEDIDGPGITEPITKFGTGVDANVSRITTVSNVTVNNIIFAEVKICAENTLGIAPKLASEPI